MSHNRSSEMSTKLEIQAGAHMNLSPVLYTNIIQSPYFKVTLKEKVSFPAVLNEILNQVDSIGMEDRKH